MDILLSDIIIIVEYNRVYGDVCMKAVSTNHHVRYSIHKKCQWIV